MRKEKEIFVTYCDYLASDDFFIVEHEKYLGKHINSEEELALLYDQYVANSNRELSESEKGLSDFLNNVVFVKRRIVDDMVAVNGFRGI